MTLWNVGRNCFPKSPELTDFEKVALSGSAAACSASVVEQSNLPRAAPSRKENLLIHCQSRPQPWSHALVTLHSRVPASLSHKNPHGGNPISPSGDRIIDNATETAGMDVTFTSAHSTVQGCRQSREGKARNCLFFSCMCWYMLFSCRGHTLRPGSSLFCSPS